MTHWLWSVSPDAFPAFVRAGTFALRRQGARRLADVRPGDRIFAYLTGQKVLAGEFEAVGAPFQDATALAPGVHAPHRLRVRAVAVLPPEARVPYDGFAPHLHVLDRYADLAPERRFAAVAQRVLHALPPIDGKVLQFVVQARLGADPDALMAAVEAVRDARDARRAERARASPSGAPSVAGVAETPAVYAGGAFALGPAVERLVGAVEARGYVFEPFEIAAYVTALRTRPLALLAGITGVGKSRLPALVAALTGGAAHLVPVRPDWTDPAEALGYTDLAGRFRPGAVLRAARAATEDPARQHVLILDEMNLGRPEHYLAEVLSRVEARAPGPLGPESPALLTEALAPPDAAWQAVRLPPNLSLVGTVNVDEGGHPLSRRVLDRAFTLELGARDLAAWQASPAGGAPEPWPAAAWRPRALRLAGLTDLDADGRRALDEAVAVVAEADALLAPAGLGVGFRTRDEVALFVLHARDTPDAFRTRAGAPVGALDLALRLRLVPRLDGARAAAHHAVRALLGWAAGRDPDEALAGWTGAGRPEALRDARFRLTAARLARILETAQDDGVASFWS